MQGIRCCEAKLPATGRAALAVMVLLPMLLWAVGCKSEPPIALARPLSGELLDRDAVINNIMADAGRWVSLEADCALTIRAPQIRAPQNQADFVRGKLKLLKTTDGRTMVKVEVPSGSDARVRLLGDGRRYRVFLPVFGDSYEGTYGQPLEMQARRIMLRPDDVAVALDGASLFNDRVPVAKHASNVTIIDLLTLSEKPVPRVSPASSLVYDRLQRQLVLLDRFDADGTVRSQLSLRSYVTLLGSGDNVIRMPSLIWISYPATRTSALLRLTDMKMNVQLTEQDFRL